MKKRGFLLAAGSLFVAVAALLFLSIVSSFSWQIPPLTRVQEGGHAKAKFLFSLNGRDQDDVVKMLDGYAKRHGMRIWVLYPYQHERRTIRVELEDAKFEKRITIDNFLIANEYICYYF